MFFNKLEEPQLSVYSYLLWVLYIPVKNLLILFRRMGGSLLARTEVIGTIGIRLRLGKLQYRFTIRT